MSKRMGPKFRKGTRASDRGRKTTSMQRQKLRAAARVFGTAGNRTTRIARSQLNTVTAGFLGIENKFYDTNLNLTGITANTDATGGEVDPSSTSMISTPAVGDGEQNRDGKRIMINSVQVNGVLLVQPQVNQTSADNQPQIMVALVLDTQTNGAQLNSEDVFKNLNNQGATTVVPLRNLLFASRFRVLKSEVFTLSPPTVTYDGTNVEQGGVQTHFNWYLPLQLPVNFNAGTTASVANVIDNSLHLIAYTMSTDSTPQIAYNARIRFSG